jgi:hypothetical protein
MQTFIAGYALIFCNYSETAISQPLTAMAHQGNWQPQCNRILREFLSD